MNGCVYRTKDNICEFYTDDVKGIVSFCDYESCVDKHPSNADRIRAMTDEELAEWINKHDCHTNYYGYDPKDAVFDWLKQEAEEDAID